MNIYFESPQRLKIELSADDLSELGITYEELDYRSEHTRQVIGELLCRIGADEEFGISSRRIIEILPRGDDGCTMYFTAVNASAVVAKKRHNSVSVWETDSVDALFCAARILANFGCKAKISLYLYNDRYRLVIADSIDKAMLPALGEFARKCGERHAALFTSEHGKLLSVDLLRELI